MTTRVTDEANFVIRRRASLLEADVSGELVALNVDSGTCYGFNRTATRIWELIQDPISIGDLCDRLTAEFAIDRATCVREVTKLVSELESDRLVEIDKSGSAL